MNEDFTDTPSLDELIKKLYDALNDSQVSQEQIYSLKALIQSLLQASLLVFHKHKEQKLTTFQHKKALTSLKLISHAIQKIPEIIVYSTQCPLNSTPDNNISFSQLYVPLKKHKFIGSCFECWLINHLTILLFEEKFKNLYAPIIEIISIIFKILLDKSDNYRLFRQLFSDYILFFEEILHIYIESENQIYPVNLVCFKNKKAELETSLLNKSQDEIKILLCNICTVIENIFKYTIQYSSDFLKKTIEMIIHNLMIINKDYSLSEPILLGLLKLCCTLVQLKIPISVNHLEQIYFIIFSLMVKLISYSEIKSSLNINEQLEDRVLISYEKYTCEILENLNPFLNPLKANLIYNYLSDFWIILLNINNFRNFKTQELQKTLLSSFKLFLELSNTLPSELIIESLIKILYHTQKDNAEIIIDCLIQYDSLKNDSEQKENLIKSNESSNQQNISDKKHTLSDDESESM
ncbi:hypothetical protein U3516DRAFT_564569 [Neocallimastix sp. 'constans']